jgi:hypothetical protein
VAVATSLSRKRRIVIWTLVVLATVLALVSILTTFVNRQMLDNTAWKKATTQVIEDPQVQSAIGNFTVNQLYENVDVTAALQKRLPPRLQSLAPTISGALEQPAARGVALLLQRPKVQQVFINASAIAHQKLVNVLENKTGYGIQTGTGVVTLNLHELVVELGTQLGLSSSTLAKLPAKAGTVTLLKSSQLSAAQTGVRAIHVLSIWLLIAVLALYGLAIYLAHGRRRATLRNAGFGLVIVGLLVLIIRNLLGNYLTDALASPGYEPATHRLYLIGTAILGQIGQATLLYGAVAAVGAILAGPTTLATRLRRGIAPTMNEQPGIVWGAVAVLYLLAILWGGTHALRTWWGILLLGALVALGVFALRRQTMEEFPTKKDAAPAPAAPADDSGTDKPAAAEPT